MRRPVDVFEQQLVVAVPMYSSMLSEIVPNYRGHSKVDQEPDHSLLLFQADQDNAEQSDGHEANVIYLK